MFSLECSLRRALLFQVRFVILLSANIEIDRMSIMHKNITDNQASGLYCTGGLSGFYYNEVSSQASRFMNVSKTLIRTE